MGLFQNQNKFNFLSKLSAGALLSLFGMHGFAAEEDKMILNPQKTVFEVPKDKIRKVVLENGMTILAYKDTSAPKVLIQIAYDIGSAVEQSHERGLAHLVEHMIFKGTDKLSETDIPAIAQKYGAMLNASTSQDVTTYFFGVDKANWHNFAEIMADCMQNASFDEEHLASELKAVVQELNMRRDNHVLGMFEKAMSLVFPSNHPYHFPIIGFKEELASLTAEDVKNFYEKYYHPERATLFLVGDIDLEKDVDFVSQIFDEVPATESAPRPEFPPVIPAIEAVKTTVYHEVQAPISFMYWATPGRVAAQEEVATILASILGNGQTGRLQQKLVEELKIATSVQCMPYGLDQAGMFLILFMPKPGMTEECYQVISHELEKITAYGIEESELQRAIAKRTMAFLTGIEHPTALVYSWIASYFATRDEFDVFGLPAKIEAITSDILAQFVQKNLNPLIAGKIDLLPLPEHAKPLWQDAMHKIRTQELAILESHKRTTEVEKPEFLNTLDDVKSFDFNFPEPTEVFTLPCGLKVLLKVDKKLPMVNAQFAFKDSGYFSQTKEGFIVGLMANMLLEGSLGYSKKQNTDALDLLGADYGFSVAGGGLRSTSANFSQVLEQFFRIMTQPDFKQDEFEKIRAISLTGLDFQKDNPMSRAQRELNQILYKNTEFDWSFEAARKHIENLTLDQLIAQHKELVQPESMLFVVVGDVNPATLKQQLENLTANWLQSETWIQKDLPSPQVKNQDDVKVPMLRDQAVLILGRGSDVDFYHPDSVLVDILSKILFGGMASRIFQIRQRTGLFYTASGGFNSGSKRAKGFDYLFTILNPQNVEAVKQLLAQMFDEVRQNGVTAEELAAAKQITLQGLVNHVSINKNLRDVLTSLEIEDLGFDYYKKYWNQVQSLTVDQVNAAAKKYCTLENMATIQVGGV